MNGKIYIKDWLTFKPYDQPSKTDLYYLRLANEVYDALKKEDYLETIELFTTGELMDAKHLACFLTAYFEDQVSGTNLWNTFVQKHKKMYGRTLPFLDTSEEYYEGEINKEDVNFLIWYYITCTMENEEISPLGLLYQEMASAVMEVFEKEWEYAPENSHLKAYYQVDQSVDGEYYQVRSLADRLLFQSYLFFPDAGIRLVKALSREDFDEHKKLLMNEMRDEKLNQVNTRLLSLSTWEWVAEYLGEKHPLYSALLNMKGRVSGVFYYKEQNETHVTLEHVATGKRFDLFKESFDDGDKLKIRDELILISMVFWNGEWWLSGVYGMYGVDKRIELKEKDSMQSKRNLAFLDFDSKVVKELVERKYQLFLEFNNGSSIAFIPAQEIETFTKDFMCFYTDTLALDSETLEEAKRKIRSVDHYEDSDGFDEEDSALVFMNPNSGIEIGLYINSAFPMPENPYYEEEEEDEHVMILLADKTLSKELVEYCLQHCKDKLQFFKSDFGKPYLENVDFFMRYWKREYYHSIPQVTMVDQVVS